MVESRAIISTSLMELILNKIVEKISIPLKPRVLNLGHDQRGHEIRNDASSEPYVLISSSHDILQFDHEKSVALCIGVDEQFHHDYASKSLGDIVARDAQAMGEAFSTHLGLDFDEVKVRKSSAQPDDCTKKGIGTLFLESAKKVQQGGIFIFYFAGHGILIGDRCVLAPADFAGKEDLNSGISGKDLVEWLHAADCKANHVLIILDCCYAGDLGTILTSPDNMLKIKPGLYVMCGCAAREKCTSVDALGHSIFTYFFLQYLERHQCIGRFAIKQAMEDISELCLSFSLLLISHDEEQLHAGNMNPTLGRLDVHAHDIDVGIPIDEPDFCRFELIIRLFDEGPKPFPHPVVEKWLKQSMIHEALTTLYTKVTLSEELQKGIFSAMLYSAASIQYVHDKTHLEERNLFLTTVISILGAIGFAYPEVNVTIFHLITGLQHYSQAAIVGEMKTKSLNDLFTEMIEEATKGNENTMTAGPTIAAENGDDEVDCFAIQPSKFNKVLTRKCVGYSHIIMSVLLYRRCHNVSADYHLGSP